MKKENRHAFTSYCCYRFVALARAAAQEPLVNNAAVSLVPSPSPQALPEAVIPREEAVINTDNSWLSLLYKGWGSLVEGVQGVFSHQKGIYQELSGLNPEQVYPVFNQRVLAITEQTVLSAAAAQLSSLKFELANMRQICAEMSRTSPHAHLELSALMFHLHNMGARVSEKLGEKEQAESMLEVNLANASHLRQPMSDTYSFLAHGEMARFYARQGENEKARQHLKAANDQYKPRYEGAEPTLDTTFAPNFFRGHISAMQEQLNSLKQRLKTGPLFTSAFTATTRPKAGNTRTAEL